MGLQRVGHAIANELNWLKKENLLDKPDPGLVLVTIISSLILILNQAKVIVNQTTELIIWLSTYLCLRSDETCL